MIRGQNVQKGIKQENDKTLTINPTKMQVDQQNLTKLSGHEVKSWVFLERS